MDESGRSLDERTIRRPATRLVFADLTPWGIEFLQRPIETGVNGNKTDKPMADLSRDHPLV